MGYPWASILGVEGRSPTLVLGVGWRGMKSCPILNVQEYKMRTLSKSSDFKIERFVYN